MDVVTYPCWDYWHRLILISAWRRHENMSPCIGNRVNSNHKWFVLNKGLRISKTPFASHCCVSNILTTWPWHMCQDWHQQKGITHWIQQQSQSSHGSPAMKFLDLFPTFSWQNRNFYWLFAAWKYDFLTFATIHTGHTDAKKIIAATIWQKNTYNLSFYVLYQLNHDIIYKMSNTMEIRFPIFLHFLLATMRLSNHIMMCTVKIWNEAFILISTPFFLTFSWLFGDFKNFLTLFKIYWLFPDFLRF